MVLMTSNLHSLRRNDAHLWTNSKTDIELARCQNWVDDGPQTQVQYRVYGDSAYM